jgi:hypothetical protein
VEELGWSADSLSLDSVTGPVKVPSPLVEVPAPLVEVLVLLLTTFFAAAARLALATSAGSWPLASCT